jgi:hypothetical protein
MVTRSMTISESGRDLGPTGARSIWSSTCAGACTRGWIETTTIEENYRHHKHHKPHCRTRRQTHLSAVDNPPNYGGHPVQGGLLGVGYVKLQASPRRVPKGDEQIALPYNTCDPLVLGAELAIATTPRLSCCKHICVPM